MAKRVHILDLRELFRGRRELESIAPHARISVRVHVWRILFGESVLDRKRVGSCGFFAGTGRVSTIYLHMIALIALIAALK